MTAIVDYDTGNLRSVADAMRRIGAEFTITAYPALLRGADRVLLPGVGEASSAMAKLRERGLDLVIPRQRASPSSLSRHNSCMPMQMPSTG